jgi:UDP-N-acetylglucosamine acyltransferase
MINTFIGNNVKIGSNVVIGNNVVIENDVTIEDNCVISHGVIIGQSPQHLSFKNKKTGKIIIGSGTHLREYCTVHLPINKKTVIGKNCFIMNHVNIGHDVRIGNNVVVSNGSQIGGHCFIDDNVNLGLNCSIHQNTFIGAHSLIGMNTSVKNNVEPFSIIYQNKKSINITGIKRSEFKIYLRDIIDVKKNKKDFLSLDNKKAKDYFGKYNNEK